MNHPPPLRESLANIGHSMIVIASTYALTAYVINRAYAVSVGAICLALLIHRCIVMIYLYFFPDPLRTCDRCLEEMT